MKRAIVFSVLLVMVLSSAFCWPASMYGRKESKKLDLKVEQPSEPVSEVTQEKEIILTEEQKLSLEELKSLKLENEKLKKELALSEADLQKDEEDLIRIDSALEKAIAGRTIMESEYFELLAEYNDLKEENRVLAKAYDSVLEASNKDCFHGIIMPKVIYGFDDKVISAGIDTTVVKGNIAVSVGVEKEITLDISKLLKPEGFKASVGVGFCF